MNEIIKLLTEIEDPRQAHKVKHSIVDVLLLVLFAKIANIETWEEVEDFGLHYEKELKNMVLLKMAFLLMIQSNVLWRLFLLKSLLKCKENGLS